MRHFSLKSLAVVGVAVVALSGCNAMKDLDKDYYSVNPNPLEVHGGKVKVDIKGQFPEKLFKKTVAIEVTPDLRYEGGQKPLKMAEFQGEEYPGNATVIPYETGKTVTYADEITYIPEFENSELFITIVGKKGDKRKDFEPIKIGDGVITTSLLVEDEYLSSSIGADYKQVTNKELSGMVNFKVNSSSIRSSELRDADYKEIEALIKSAGKDDNVTIENIVFNGFASPEGEATLNENLSGNRAKNVENKIKSSVKRSKIKYQDGFFTRQGQGADWDGVYSAIKESNIEDKDMILRSLDDQPLLATKEKTLQSLANTYDVLKEDILPQLRRTQIVVNYNLVGKSDEQIKELASKSAEELKVEITKSDNTKAYQLDAEEILYAAKMANTKEAKLNLMKKGMELYPNDYRFATNAGHCSQKLGKTEEAATLFEKAYQIEENDITINNLGIAKSIAGDSEAAAELFAKSTTAEASYNKGVKAIKDGEYDKAIEAMQGQNTFNLALAKVLNGDYDGGIKTIEAGNIESAKADYLKAIASERLGKTNDAKNFLNSAFGKDSMLEEKAKTDLEFREIYNSKTEEEK
ncbi:MAG: hypothetical protein KAG96_07940 [Ichthyobacteriaceae bacterium]|nr:hypothetical protein [Ichthyobacteriaceae bacterium]